MKKILPITLYIASATLPIGLYSCSKTTATETVVQEATHVEAITLAKGGVRSDLKIPGELIADQQVDLYAKVNGFVKRLHVDVGQQVRTGTLLASIEAPEVFSQLAGAESRLKSYEAQYIASKATYQRLLETSKTPGTISPNDLDLAFAKQQSDAAMYESAKAAYNELSDAKNYLEIRAPFSGVIAARNVSTGAYVGPSGRGSEAPIFTLVDQQKLRLVISIPEAYSHYINKEAEVTFTVRSSPSQVYTGKVTRLAGALDSRLRSQRVEIDVPNLDKKLLPGMVAEVKLPLFTDDNSFNVPVGTVLNSSQGYFIIKIVDKKAVWTPVTIGRNDGANVEVIGELSEGDILVKNANEEVRNLSEVKIITKEK